MQENLIIHPKLRAIMAVKAHFFENNKQGGYQSVHALRGTIKTYEKVFGVIALFSAVFVVVWFGGGVHERRCWWGGLVA